jgi:hypothetical protein
MLGRYSNLPGQLRLAAPFSTVLDPPDEADEQHDQELRGGHQDEQRRDPPRAGAS